MPNVSSDSGCSAATVSAARTARWNSRSGSMTWSAELTMMVASGSARAIRAAPRPTHAAVSRPTGSPTIWSAGTSGSCRRASSTWAAAVMTQVRSAGIGAAVRSNVPCNSVRSPLKVRNCFGRAVRLRGQNRVPPPPAMIIECSINVLSSTSPSRGALGARGAISCRVGTCPTVARNGEAVHHAADSSGLHADGRLTPGTSARSACSPWGSLLASSFASSAYSGLISTGTVQFPSTSVGTVAPAAVSQRPARLIWSRRDDSGESVPVAFFTGANSSSRATLIVTYRSARGRASKTNISNFRAFSVVGVTGVFVPGSQQATFFLATWYASRSAPRVTRSRKLDREDVDRRVAGPVGEFARRVPLGGHRGRHVRVFHDPAPAVNLGQHADLFFRPVLEHDLRRHVRVVLDVPAEEPGVGDVHQRVVDLEVEDVADAAGLQFGEQAAVGQGGERPAVPVRAEEQRARLLQEQLAGGHVEGRHRALLEVRELVGGQAEPIVLGEVRFGLGVRGRAGHDQERDRHPVPAGQGQDLLGVDAEQAGPGHRADREHPLRLVEPEPTALPAGDEQDRDLAGPQRRLAADRPRPAGCRRPPRRTAVRSRPATGRPPARTSWRTTGRAIRSRAASAGRRVRLARHRTACPSRRGRGPGRAGGGCEPGRRGASSRAFSECGPGFRRSGCARRVTRKCRAQPDLQVQILSKLNPQPVVGERHVRRE